MNEFTMSVVTGAVSGVVTSSLIFAIASLIRRELLPRYRQVVYQGIQLGGEWHSELTPFNQNIKLDLKQRATHMSGLAVYVNEVSDEKVLERVRTFSLSGYLNDRFLQLRLVHVDQSRLGVISYLLEVVGDGRRLVGACAYYDLETDRISHHDITFTRHSVDPESQSE